MPRIEGKLSGQVAIVTGAAQGMGAETARTFYGEGGSVVLCDVQEEQVERIAKELEPDGARSLGLRTDVTKPDEVKALVSATVDRFGKIDILVNNAGVLRWTPVDEIPVSEWDLILDVNLKGTFLCSQAVLPNMKANGHGRIINMSSTAGRSVSTLGGAHYTTAKAGVLGFTRALAKEMAPFGITANAVCPGLIDTEMARENCPPERLGAYEEKFPIARMGRPEEVARLILFLATDASYITGAAFDINGGDLMI